MADRPYVRVYYEIVDDEKFANVYSDDKSLATWLRLLLSADASYPSSAPVPRWVSQKTLTTLEDAGLIRVHGHHYTIVGLAAERERRRAIALSGGLARGKQLLSERSPNAHLTVSLSEPSRAELSRAESARAPARGSDEMDDPYEVYYAATGKYPDPQGKAAGWITRLVDQYRAADVARAIAEAAMTDRVRPLEGASNILARRAVVEQRKEDAEQKERIAAKRAPLKPLPSAGDDLSDEDAERMIREYKATAGR